MTILLCKILYIDAFKVTLRVENLTQHESNNHDKGHAGGCSL